MDATLSKEDTKTMDAKTNGGKPEAPGNVDVNVNVTEATGIVILGILFFFVLMALLRSQRRERKMMEEIAKLRAQLTPKPEK